MTPVIKLNYSPCAVMRVAVDPHPIKSPSVENATMYIGSLMRRSQWASCEVLCKSPRRVLKYCWKFFCAVIFSPVEPFGCKYHMRLIYSILTLTPAPIFLIGFVYSVVNITHMPACGSHSWEMPIMWFTMFLAHSVSWVMWLQQRNFTRNWKTAVVCAL